MNILEKQWIPLTEEEFKTLKLRYTRNLENLNLKEALELFRLVFPLGKMKSDVDEYYFNLLLRHLHSIIDWTNYPERLL